jgi:hypothetical protein
MTDQQRWGPPQQPQQEQDPQPYGVPQQYPRQPQQPGTYGWATSPSGSQQPPPGYQQPPPVYGYQPPTQQGYPSGPGHQAPRSPKRRHTVRNVLLGAVGAIVLLIIIGVAASSQNGLSKSSTPPAANAATKAPSSPGPSAASNNSTTGPVGTTFVATDTNDSGATVKYSVTLDKFIQHAAPDNSFDSAPTGDHLAAAEFTIKGIVGEEQDDANSDAAATGNDNQTYQVGFEGLAAGTNFNGGDFNTDPGSVSVGWVAFEVKDGVRVTSIQWNLDGGFSGTAPATWTVTG